MSRNERFTKPHFIEKIDLGSPMIFNYRYSVYSTINVIKLQKKYNIIFEVFNDLNSNHYPLWTRKDLLIKDVLMTIIESYIHNNYTGSPV